MSENIVIDKNSVSQGHPIALTINGMEVWIFKVKADYVAIRNWCPHQGGPVCKGQISGTLARGPDTNWELKWFRDGEILVCPWHGLEFDMRSGECLALHQYTLTTYRVFIRGEKLFVETGVTSEV